MRFSRWRAGTGISNAAKIIHPFVRSLWQSRLQRRIFHHSMRGWRDVVWQPMGEIDRGVRVVHYDSKAPRSCRGDRPLQVGRNIAAIAGVPRRHLFPIGKARLRTWRGDAPSRSIEFERARLRAKIPLAQISHKSARATIGVACSTGLLILVFGFMAVAQYGAGRNNLKHTSSPKKRPSLPRFMPRKE